ncbi:MAG: hypothetical protein QME48_03340 [bacterium]|nr:hypothetical protein [bacterium]
MKILKIFFPIFFFIFLFSQEDNTLENKFLEYKKEFDGYQQVIEFDEENDLVLFKTFYKGNFLFIDSIKPKDLYLSHKNQNMIKEMLSASFKESFKTSSSSGLIGDIDIPITFGKMKSFFGEGGKLVVEGSERIDYSGSKTFDLTAMEKGTANISWIPEFMLKQQLIVNVTGTVGERIKVNLKHNSETERKSDNTVVLEYKGLDDDILQSVQAGDISLSLPGIKLIGGTPQHKGLFGLKGSGQLGGLNYTFVASKESGENEQKQFVGNTSVDSLKIYDIDYQKNRFFLLGLSQSDSIILLNVYKDDGIGSNNDEEGVLPAKLYFDPSILDSLFFIGNFSLMIPGEDKDYIYYKNGQFIEFTTTLPSSEVIGISYIVKRSDGRIDTVGSFGTVDTLILKIIKQKDDYPFSPTWEYMMKNVYSFTSKNIIPESFKLSIKKVNTGSGDDYELQGNTTYLKLLGLDQNGDGNVDLNFVDFNRGFLIFPSLYPFDSDSLIDKDSIIYWTLESGTSIGRKYYLDIKFSGSQSVYSLGTFNIIEGSEVVKVNGVTLTKDKDYTIDYEYGIVNFLTDAVNSPNAQITIDYQYSPFLSLTSKNLLGMHLDYQLSDKLFANSNWIYNTLSYNLEDYPRIGEEPQEILLGEGDIKYDENFYTLSDLANLLPFYNTTSPSKFSVVSKVALSKPENNSAKKASIENMESVIVSNDISIDRKSWVFGSLPSGFDPNNLSEKYFWYNAIELNGNINSLLPDVEKTKDVSVLKIFMDNPLSSSNTFVTLNQLISRTGIDLTDMMFLEIWVKGEEGNVVIEVGKNIPEDMVRRDKNKTLLGPDGILQTEDKNNDGILDVNEDTGLDGVYGEDSLNIVGDDGNDDYYYSLSQQYYYEKINGTENNNMFDSEDLDRDGSLNTREDYYRFNINLGSDENLVYENPSTGWKLFRIPLQSSSVQKVGNPDLKYIKYSRLYWYGVSKDDTLSIYQISMVTNKWKSKMVNGDSTKFFFGAKNNQTDPDYYPPFNPGVDFNGKPKREQSMVIYCKGFEHDEAGKVYKILPLKESYERYEMLQFYIRSTDSDSFDFYLKFGGDSLNYYFIKYNPRNEWDTVTVYLDSLVNLKKSNLDKGFSQKEMYGFLGSPSLTNIGYLELYIQNKANTLESTEVWVDDIMVIGPKNELGYAGDISSTLEIPELFSVTFLVGLKNPYFKTVSEKYGSGNFNNNYRFSASLNGEKLLPEFFGIVSPITYSYSRSINRPVYYIGSDYTLSSDEVKRFSNYSTSKGFSVNLKRGKNFTNRFLHYILDIPSFSYSNSFSNNFTYNRTDTTKTNSLSSNFTYNFGIVPLKLFKGFEIYYFPSNISYNLSYSTNQTKSFLLGENGFVNVGENYLKNFNRSFSTKYRIFRSLEINYSESKIHDLLQDDNEFFGLLGKRTGQNNNFNLNYNPSFIKYITHTLNVSTNFSERNNKNLYSLDSLFSTDLSQSFRLSLNGNVDYAKILKLITSLRDESKDSLVIVGSPQWIIIYFDKFLDNLSGINYSYSTNRTTSFNYVRENPPFFYKIGLWDTLPADYISSYSQNRKNTNYSYSFSSGLSFWNIDLRGSYSYSYNRSGQNENIIKDINRKWPNLSFTLSNIEQIGPFGKYLRFLNLTTSISKGEIFSFINDTLLNRNNTSLDFYPLVGLSGATSFNLNFNYNLNYSKSISNSYSSLTLSRENKTFSNTLSFNYSFSSPSGFNIPLIKKVVKFKSNLNTGIDFSYTKVQDVDITNNNTVEDKILYDIKPRADYNFTNNVSGGINITFSRSEDMKRGDKRQLISLGFWTLFRF